MKFNIQKKKFGHNTKNNLLEHLTKTLFCHFHDFLGSVPTLRVVLFNVRMSTVKLFTLIQYFI